MAPCPVRSHERYLRRVASRGLTVCLPPVTERGKLRFLHPLRQACIPVCSKRFSSVRIETSHDVVNTKSIDMDRRFYLLPVVGILSLISSLPMQAQNRPQDPAELAIQKACRDVTHPVDQEICRTRVIRASLMQELSAPGTDSSRSAQIRSMVSGMDAKIGRLEALSVADREQFAILEAQARQARRKR